MAAVFPESMDRLNTQDVPGSLSKIENYIRYMTERTEFSMRNVTRDVSNAGISSAEMYILLTALQNSVSALTSTVQGIAGDVNTAKGELSALRTDLDDATKEIAALSGRVSALEKR